MKVVYSPNYHIDLGLHVFPTVKYRLLADRLRSDRRLVAGDWVAPEMATWDTLALVHTDEYLYKVREDQLSAREIAELELPWSEGMVEGFRLMAGGTITAARLGAQEGMAVHLGGGFHHAFRNHGEGFCLFNDVAVAVRVLQREGLADRVAIVDCDVHQGNGTAMIFEGDPTVFTFSIHQQHNYPLFKPRSDLDIGVEDGIGDDAYLKKLAPALSNVFGGAPDTVFYLAGADPFQRDQLGGLALTMDGLRRRDRMVLEAARASARSVIVTLAGGYAQRIEDTVAIHLATVEEALDVEGRRSR